MTTSLLGIILRSSDRIRLQKFYTALGLTFTEHQHGGPLHAECSDIDKDFVLEAYAASDNFPDDALMLRVDSLSHTLSVATAAGAEILRPAKTQGTFQFAYIADPDGRPIMLIESDR